MNPQEADLIVLGSGPGGYAAAFYAADKGRKVILVEKEESLGGVCLHRGCIPSKALLNVAHLMTEAKLAEQKGITFTTPKIDLQKMREWKQSILDKLSSGVRDLAKRRNVEVIKGRGFFHGNDILRVETEEGQKFYKYNHVIAAVGSRPALPKAFDLGSKRIMTSTEALDIEEIPKKVLVIGGGYIGMELGTVYDALGSEVSVVEALPQILGGADADLVRPVGRYVQSHFKKIRTATKVTKMSTEKKQVKVDMEASDGMKITEVFDRILVSVGRVPNTEDLGLENTKVELDEKGFIKANNKQQTADPKIYAIGDVAGGALLAHKASKEARIAVEVLSGEDSAFDDIVIPAVVFTTPELAWCGLTENEAKAKGISIKIVRFPWAASGRALTLGQTDGLTKLVLEPETERILGMGIVGYGAGDMISEGVLAMEMGATARDIAESVHPHPTLSETIMESAEVFYGYATHMHQPKRKPL